MSVSELTSMSELDALVRDNRAAVVDFWAEWCGPCRALAPIFKEVSESLSGMAFAKVNIEAVQEAGEKFGIQSIPCLVVFKDGKEAGRVLGLQSKDMLKAKLEKFLV